MSDIISTEDRRELEVETRPNTATMTQFVRADGSLTKAGVRHAVDPEVARKMYRDMARARRFDQEALALQRQGELGLWLQSWGQEAAQVASMYALDDRDFVFPSYREHAAAMVRGITPTEILSQWRGATHAGWDPERYNFHYNSLVLGTQTLHANGYALGCKLSGGNSIVATYFGDGAASQGDVSEAFNWAAARSLPVLFICQNNQWAISTPTDLQYAAPVHQRAAGFGLRTFFVDGNDALAVLEVTRAAADIVRSGTGPALIEAVTYRMAGHSTSDDPRKYREAAELDLWTSRDPLHRLGVVVAEQGATSEFFSELDEELDALAIEVRAACRAIRAPELDSIFDNAYAEPHPGVRAEKQALRKYNTMMAGETS
ncbi:MULTISPECIES: thiamine pyrophosphate-dependent enzyme [unclassified Rhodococcus (in: high G+C Gram-positive bacteria)]|uniref:thiamine pyrophosphate-dependent enzyme n=1 Tax=unclassified Rhodococcus (in: high G+C Gram-positive bacteria) TaxID=192944 RepID=UPI00211ADD46|nr:MULTISPECIES: thiamine pyrophosphate-dependent enzyme [unclassified Rhodococcus (in: high G+C Gram-positive bacteria)]